jgi:D-glycero-D-manno-heptose 1,7-bisphosphate phosphatase
VFLDRDGVVNRLVVDEERRVERPPWSLDELEALPDALPACDLLRAHGMLLVVVSNQPDIAARRVAAETVEGINNVLIARLGLHAVYVCPHASGGRCRCRKPRPGMLFDAAADHAIDLTASWMVGDRWVDVAAGRAAGVGTVLVERPTSWTRSSAGRPSDDLTPDARADSLLEAAQIILGDASRPS